jgi:hypothetical protein
MRKEAIMNRRRIVPALLIVALGACDDGILDLRPVDRIDNDLAIIDAASAEAALVGAYSALQGGSLYGGSYVMLSETMTDNVEHTGTFATYADADLNEVTSDNGTIGGIWDASYNGIYRLNLILHKVPTLSDIPADDSDRILGESYALRALHYHNLVRGFGEVPLVLEPFSSIEEASNITRDAVPAIYTQILADLTTAESLLDAAGRTNNPASVRTRVTPGFIDALRARVELYQGNWAQAESAARAVVGSADYDLAPSYADLFDANGAATSEDIFRVAFTASDFNNLGFYYRFAGRFEIGATQEIYDAYPAGDARFDVTFEGIRSDGIEVAKFPTTEGTENLHVIRLGEVMLILAEALAQQGGAAQLTEAVDLLNELRDRADLGPLPYGTQAAVLAAIHQERRLELAFEGDRWYDLVRSGRAMTELPGLETYQQLFPIPLAELDVANLEQNPGY